MDSRLAAAGCAAATCGSGARAPPDVMGDRGIKRPEYCPEGTRLIFTWPMGMSRGQRDYLARKARQEVGDDGGDKVRWLQRNAWKHLNAQGGQTMVEADELTGMVSPDYVYRAVTVSVYDGDTITVDIDCGFGVWLKKQKLRLYGINAPEMRGEERELGRVSRDALRAMLPVGKSIVIATKRDKKGKYGRWLAEVYYSTYQNPSGPMMSATEALVQRGFAKRAVY